MLADLPVVYYSAVELHFGLLYFFFVLFKMTVVVPLSVFLRFKAEFFFNSFRAVTLLRDKLCVGLVTVTSSSGAFDTFQVALMGNTSLNRWRELLPNFTFVCYGCWDKFETL